jgi:RNA polymerase sigma factor FliA
MSQSAIAIRPARAGPTVNELVEGHLALVRQLVSERLAKVPDHVRRDELTSAGMLALVLSAQNWNPSRGVPFGHYAAFRIRGALIDELRAMDWATRSVRGRAREIESVRGHLTSELDRTPRTDEVAAAMSLSSHELAALQSDLARANVMSLHCGPTEFAELPGEMSPGPESMILRRETLGYLHDAIAELSERLRFIVIAHFFDQRAMSDIATELGVSVVRISQLCAVAVRQLRDGMNSQLDPSAVDMRLRSGRAAANRQAYFGAIASRGTLMSRLAMSTIRGDMRQCAKTSAAKIA